VFEEVCSAANAAHDTSQGRINTTYTNMFLKLQMTEYDLANYYMSMNGTSVTLKHYVENYLTTLKENDDTEWELVSYKDVQNLMPNSPHEL
jgi:hypothetical protein